MKEKIKNFLLKIKNSLCCEIKTPVYKLMLFGIIMIFLSCICFSCSNFVNSTLNDNSNTVENVDSDINLIDRDIKGANPTLSDYVNSSIKYNTLYLNMSFRDTSIFSNLTFLNFLGIEGYPIYLTSKFDDSSGNVSSNTYYLLYLSNSNNVGFSVYYSVINRTGTDFTDGEDFNTYATLVSSDDIFKINNFIDIRGAYVVSNLLGQIPIGTQNQLLYNFISTQPFEYSSTTDIDTSSLTLNETNFDSAVYFSTFLTKESIAGYFSQLTYETTNFITPSLTLNSVDSYTIITGRIGSVPIANYIPSLVVVKFESKYVVYNYLRDNYLTPIYDTSTGVLDNVLGDGIYFLDVSSPTYFGSQNDKFNLFISAINIADSPLYSLISIGYNNGYDFGYGYGYNTGYQVGFGDGDESGYNEGYDTGFENGFADGRDTANPLGPVMSLFKDTADVVASVLNVQILPNLTIGTILLFPLVALLFALFIRLFFGG